MGMNVGIDVSKHSLDWTSGSKGKLQHTRNEPRAIAHLLRRMAELDPERIVVESTGGYERPVVQKLAEAGLPVVVVNPVRVRRFAEGLGLLAKTDAADAQVLALYGEKAGPPIRPIPMGRSRLLADLIARRRQLVSILVAEKGRREAAPRAAQASITRILRALEREVDGIDQRIQKAIEDDLCRGTSSLAR